MTCPCQAGKGRKTRRNSKKRGGSLIGDAVLAGTALGLYSYFKKKGGAKQLLRRKTRKAYV